MVQAATRNEVKVSLVDILVSQGMITDTQVGLCEIAQLTSQDSIEHIILNKGYATRDAIASSLETYYDVPYMELNSYDIDPEVIKLVPERLTRRYKFLPLFKISNKLSISIVNPKNLFGIDEIRDTVGCDIETTVSTEEQIFQALDIVDQIVSSEFGDDDVEVEVEKVKELDLEKVSEAMLEKAPVVKLLNTIIQRAIREKKLLLLSF
jgi:type IV pilus assembly protein PilB